MNHRIQTLRSDFSSIGIDAAIIMNFENQFYYSGLKAITYSRPIVLGIDQNETHLIIPSLEEEHAKDKTDVDKLYVYHETKLESSRGESYLDYFVQMLAQFSPNARIGIEYSSCPVILRNILADKGFTLLNVDSYIAEKRFIKDDVELNLIKESGRLVSLALKHSLENAKAGITEIELDQYGNSALFDEVARTHPNSTLDFFVMSPSGVKRTNMPHVFSNTRKLENNDIIIHSRQVGFNGYRAECERTFFIGEPTAEQRKVFSVAVEAQLKALEEIKIGMRASEVNEIARQIIADAGYEKYMKHRTGHGIGIGLHEEPSLRFDNELVLQKGMVFCVEPGIYVPGIGGFRHSDTVILSDKGTELITQYPYSIEELIIEKR
ncbi:Xaa-Pro peptidase family protein [Sporosarcina saromensis]|uniref:Xaa-Pro peptidase family protein n=1 Tax=Sporosarcina saromensis TaxID=359365 RepID=A0ABU4GBP2_9BACL|nr:Xaa-Pro peptidase family protein [Sporosarcina saromensis]MDW0114411.1 Xaa-Pro peptidase family protein [Sporosarcina saromensis]